MVSPVVKSHFFLSEENQEEPVLSTPFGCREMAREFCELLDKASHGVEGGLPENGVERDGFHPFYHHLGDGGHSCRDLRHGCAVRALKSIS